MLIRFCTVPLDASTSVRPNVAGLIASPKSIAIDTGSEFTGLDSSEVRTGVAGVVSTTRITAVDWEDVFPAASLWIAVMVYVACANGLDG